MASIFSRIISGEIPSHKILEDENHLAFLDVSPIAKGHTLVVPKKEVDYIFDMEDNDLASLMTFSKKVALALKLAIPSTKIGVSIIGLEVSHVHVHLVPINSIKDMTFGKIIQMTNEQLIEISIKVKSYL
jgi:histidine triad (HIT) family protein